MAAEQARHKKMYASPYNEAYIGRGDVLSASTMAASPSVSGALPVRLLNHMLFLLSMNYRVYSGHYLCASVPKQRTQANYYKTSKNLGEYLVEPKRALRNFGCIETEKCNGAL